MLTSRYTLASRGGRLVAAAALVAVIVACNTDRFLRVEDPDNTTPGTLQGASALPALRNSAIGEFQVGFSGSAGTFEFEGLVNMTGLFTDEFFFTETFPTRVEVDRRAINVDNVTMRDIFFTIQRARAAALRASKAFAQFGASEPGRSEVLSLQAYAIDLMGEAYCNGVPLSEIDENSNLVAGQPLTNAQLFQLAADTFQTALDVATAAGDDDLANFARVGKARALVNLGRENLAEAAALVASVPTEFQYIIFHSENTPRQWNGVYEFSWLEGRWVQADLDGGNGLPFRSADDPRTPFQVVPGATFTGDTLFGTLKYPDPGSDVVLASGVEARLIEAEAALQNGDPTTFLTRLNDLRAGSGLPLDALPDPGTTTGREDLLFRERAFWMYLTAHRLGDLRRLVRQYGRGAEAVFPTGTYEGRGGGVYGTDVNFPIPVEELNNPNLSGSSTCIDRNP